MEGQPTSKKARITVAAKPKANERCSTTKAAADPFEHLQDENLCSYILSFIGGRPLKKLVTGPSPRDHHDSLRTGSSRNDDHGNNDDDKKKDEKKGRPSYTILGVDIREAAIFYQSIASVSRRWRAVMDESIVNLVDSLTVDFSNLPHGLEDSLTDWTCRHKFRLTTMSYKHERSMAHCLKLLECCDTSKLRFAEVPLSLTDAVAAASHLRVHDAMAQECPILIGLVVTLDLDDGDTHKVSKLISSRLFSLPSIMFLSIKVVVDHQQVEDGNQDSDDDEEEETPLTIRDRRFLCPLTQNLPNLDFLELQCDYATLSYPGRVLPGRVDRVAPIALDVVSPTIRFLHVEEFCSVSSCFILDCPQLQSYQCRGVVRLAANNNGVGVPTFHVAQFAVHAKAVPKTCAGVIHLKKPNGRIWLIHPIVRPFHDSILHSLGFDWN